MTLRCKKHRKIPVWNPERPGAPACLPLPGQWLWVSCRHQLLRVPLAFIFSPPTLAVGSIRPKIAWPSHPIIPCPVALRAPPPCPSPPLIRHRLQQCLAFSSGAGCLQGDPRSWPITAPRPPPGAVSPDSGQLGLVLRPLRGDLEMPESSPPLPLSLPPSGHPLTLRMQQGLSVFCCEGPRSQRRCPAYPVTDGEPGHRRRGEGPARPPWKG